MGATIMAHRFRIGAARNEAASYDRSHERSHDRSHARSQKITAASQRSRQSRQPR